MSQHLVILHRWTDRYALYTDYVDHATWTVSYVTIDRARVGVPPEAAAVRIVPRMEDLPAVSAAVAELIELYGKPARIVALHEVDLDMAAVLRERLDVPGDLPAQLHPFRDKWAMYQRLHDNDVPMPATTPVPDTAAIVRFADEHGWPLIVKPARGTASIDVARLDTAAQAWAYVFPPGQAMIAQEFRDSEILHVDGIVGDGELGPWRASRYVNNPFEFTMGAPLGSVEIDDSALLGPIEEITRRTVLTMSRAPWVFHLELLLGDRDGRVELSVLELGARPGGAEVPFVWRDVHGIDLVKAAFEIQLGQSPSSGRPDVAVSGYGGWLLVPWPVPRPCTVMASARRDEDGEGPYFAQVPAAGRILAAVAGYEHSGARFRFRGGSSAEIEAAIDRTVEGLDLRCAAIDPVDDGLVAVIGSGAQVYREYAFEDAAQRTALVLVCPEPPVWQARYLRGHVTAQMDDGQDVARAVADATRAVPVTDAPAGAPPYGLLTWDEPLVEVTAEAAERLGLPHMSSEAIRNCRDKLRTRRLLAARGVSTVRYTHVTSLDEALAAAETIGYPVVVKPRALAGSFGVVFVRSPQELRDRYEQAAGARYPGLDALTGLIVEEYLDGPEISVDSVVTADGVHCVTVARKQLGFAPFFEETGHLVSPWRDAPWAEEMLAMLTEAHHALGVSTGITHAEVRLTGGGPKLVEMNARLGGDFIPLLGKLATGVDLTAAAVAVALGRRPDLTPTHERCAEARFVCPDRDGTVERVDLTAAARVPGISLAVALAEPGKKVLLPPRGFLPRLAGLIAVGEDPDECGRILKEALSLVEVAMRPPDGE